MSTSRVLLAALGIACSAIHPGEAAAVPHSRQEEPAEAPEVQILGVPSEIGEPGGPGETILAEPGTRLYREPDVRSPTVATTDVEIELAILGRREHWVRVRYASWKGWIFTGSGAVVTPANRPDQAAWRLALAREILGPASKRKNASAVERLGSFLLYTDVEDRRLLRFLSRTASHLPETYRDRYGLEPRRAHAASGASRATADAVVLFSREADYRAYEAQVRPEIDRGALGHAAYGLAVLYVGRQGPEDVAAVLVHELTHVLSYLALAASPPWLDEGMANDLAFCRIDGDRRLVLGSLGGRSVVIEEHSYRPGGWIGVDRAVHLSGPLATRDLLRKRWRDGGAIRIEALTHLSPGQFFEPRRRQLHYDVSAFFVRYLLDGEDGRHAPGFRAYLSSLSTADSGDPSALASHLGLTWGELEDAFAAWLRLAAC